MARSSDGHHVQNVALKSNRFLVMCVLMTGLLAVVYFKLFLNGRQELSGIIIVDDDTFEYYNPDRNDSYWQFRFGNLSLYQERHTAVVVVLRNQLICATGRHHDHVLNSTEILDLKTLNMHEGPSLMEARYSAAGAIFQDRFVICGGKKREGYDREVLSTCEILTAHSWITFEQLPKPTCEHQMVNLEGDIFSLGGRHSMDSTLSKSLYQWAPETHKWIRKADMNKGRNYFAATWFMKSIIACGSLTHPYHASTDDTCEIYDVAGNHWTYIASMNERRSRMAMVVFQEILFVLGGWGIDSKTETVNKESYASVERYQNGSWSSAAEMSSTRRGLAAVVVNISW